MATAGVVAVAMTAVVLGAGHGTAAPPAPKGTKNVPVHATFEVHQQRENDEPVARGSIHGVRRIEGGTILYYSLGFPEQYGTDVSFLYTHRPLHATDRWGIGAPWATPTLIDPVGKRAYTTLVSEEDGDCLCSPTSATEDEPGKLFVLYSVYSPLPPEVRSVAVTIGYDTVVIGVPVEEGALTPAVEPAQPILLGDGWPRLDVDAVAAAPETERSIADLETRLVDFGNQVTTVESPGQVSLELSTDVLFAVDSAVLTGQAQASIAKVAQTVNERVKAGTISVSATPTTPVPTAATTLSPGSGRRRCPAPWNRW